MLQDIQPRHNPRRTRLPLQTFVLSMRIPCRYFLLPQHLPRVYVDTGDEQAIQDPWAIMHAIINDLTWDGGLREPCEAASQNFCNADQQTFKGITMHYMWVLILPLFRLSFISSLIPSQIPRLAC